MTSFERPAPDLAKIVAAWRTWESRGDEVLPGRTMADLKTAGADRLLETLAADNDAITDATEAWSGWERGRVGPGATLHSLEAAGFAEIVEALAESS